MTVNLRTVAVLVIGGCLISLLVYSSTSNTSFSQRIVNVTLGRSSIAKNRGFSPDNIEITKFTDSPSLKSLQSLVNNISKLERRMADREAELFNRLDQLRGSMASHDAVDSLAGNISQKLDKMIAELQNIDMEQLNTSNQFGPKIKSDVKEPEKQKLNRDLLILAGYMNNKMISRIHVNETDSVSMNLRDLIFGGRGRDASIKNKDLFDVCPPGCEFTTDPVRFNESDVVILYAGSTAYRAMTQDLVRAFPEQRFVFFFFEQPHNFVPSDLDIINNRVGINWTMHYQQDATVYWPYGQTRVRPTPFNLQPDYASKKKRKVIWVVSRCDTLFSHREHYVAELIKYIDIDVYGKCIEGTPSRVPMDVNKVASQYKFFISFENGDCDDYITEKFFRYTKDVMIVPLVLGRRNHYEQLAPAFSYIQADQFDSPQQLAAYLHVLDKDNSLYHRYFQWRKTYTMDYMPRPVCNMCNTFRKKWFEPSMISMHKYHGYQRCWKANRNILSEWMGKAKAQNYTFTNPWNTIKALNSKDKPLRFS